MKQGCEKYIPFKPIDIPDRQWPSKTIEKPPVWCSVDLRDGNQALIDPMNMEEKLEFFQTLVDHTHQRIGGHELRVDHGGTEAAAKQTETDVGNVLHGCQQHRARTQVKCSYFHIEWVRR